MSDTHAVTYSSDVPEISITMGLSTFLIFGILYIQLVGTVLNTLLNIQSKGDLFEVRRFVLDMSFVCLAVSHTWGSYLPVFTSLMQLQGQSISLMFYESNTVLKVWLDKKYF